MAKLTKKQISQQHALLEYVVESATDRCQKFRAWRAEAAAKAYDLAEAVNVADAQQAAAMAELVKFRRLHKL